MSAFQWLFVVAVALVVAGLVQALDILLSKALRKDAKVSPQSRAARFAAIFAFGVYGMARATDPGLDRLIHPFAFGIGWLIVFGIGLHLIAERFDKDRA